MPAASASASRYRVLHTADWHLGKTLCEQSREVEHACFLRSLLSLVEHEKVDALVISGDVFDSANPPQSAEKLYYDFLAELHGLGDCAVVVTAGNHDSPTHLEAPRRLLQSLNVHVAGVISDELAETFIVLPNVEAPRLVVAAVPFLRDRDLRRGVLGQGAEVIRAELHAGLQRRYHGLGEHALFWGRRGVRVPVLATGHLTIAGAEFSDSERQIHVGGLGAIGVELFPAAFGYTALGHLHRPQAAGGVPHVRYSGSPIALSFSEALDRKEVRLLDFVGGVLVENAALQLTCPRRLVRLPVARGNLESCLGSLVIESPATHPSWLEICVEGALPGENLYELVRRLMQGRPEQVLRVTAPRPDSATERPWRLSQTEEAATETSDLLADPRRVFGRKLDGLPELPVEERGRLETAFVELQELLAERVREHGASHNAVAAQPREVAAP